MSSRFHKIHPTAAVNWYRITRLGLWGPNVLSILRLKERKTLKPTSFSCSAFILVYSFPFSMHLVSNSFKPIRRTCILSKIIKQPLWDECYNLNEWCWYYKRIPRIWFPNVDFVPNAKTILFADTKYFYPLLWYAGIDDIHIKVNCVRATAFISIWLIHNFMPNITYSRSMSGNHGQL